MGLSGTKVFSNSQSECVFLSLFLMKGSEDRGGKKTVLGHTVHRDSKSLQLQSHPKTPEIIEETHILKNPLQHY